MKLNGILILKEVQDASSRKVITIFQYIMFS